MLAARDYRAAMVHAEELGAHGQTLMLRTRLGGVLIEDGQDEAGERMLRDVLALAEGRHSGRDTVPFARMALAMWLGVSGRIAEARGELRAVRDLLGPRAPDLFVGIIESSLLSLDIDEGRTDEGLLPEFRAAMDLVQDMLTKIVAPELPVIQLLTAARVLMAVRGTHGGADAARLLGAYDALRGRSHVQTRSVRADRARTEVTARALLGDAEYTARTPKAAASPWKRPPPSSRQPYGRSSACRLDGGHGRRRGARGTPGRRPDRGSGRAGARAAPLGPPGDSGLIRTARHDRAGRLRSCCGTSRPPAAWSPP